MLERARRQLVSYAAACVDRAVMASSTLHTRKARRPGRSESFEHDKRIALLGRLAKRYQRAVEQDTFFRPSRLIHPTSMPVDDASLPSEAIGVDLRWPSHYETFLSELQERYDRPEQNQQAAVRLWLGPTPRPVVVCIHGYLGGHYALEQRIWSASRWFEQGFDVAFFTLPLHGLRALPGRWTSVPFPSSDPRFTNEGFRQAMGDLSDFVAWLKKRGHPEVGLTGMSLGGYSAALAATVIDDLSFVVPVIPLASLADYVRDHGRLDERPTQQRKQHAALDAVHRVVSPLHRPLRTGPGRVVVVGARADRITPIAHAEKLASAFDAPIHRWDGGHLLQWGRREAFAEVWRWLAARPVSP